MNNSYINLIIHVYMYSIMIHISVKFHVSPKNIWGAFYINVPKTEEIRLPHNEYLKYW